MAAARNLAFGIPAFSNPGPDRNWWMLPEETECPEDLSIVYDQGNQYIWEPNVDMPLGDFVARLATVESTFHRIN